MSKNLRAKDLFGETGQAIFAFAYDGLTDGDAEFRLIIAIVGLVVLPQLMTYVLSAPSGSARRPVFVSR